MFVPPHVGEILVYNEIDRLMSYRSMVRYDRHFLMTLTCLHPTGCLHFTMGMPCSCLTACYMLVPAGSPSSGGDVTDYV